jgi:hypothetical protein
MPPPTPARPAAPAAVARSAAGAPRPQAARHHRGVVRFLIDECLTVDLVLRSKQMIHCRSARYRGPLRSPADEASHLTGSKALVNVTGNSGHEARHVAHVESRIPPDAIVRLKRTRAAVTRSTNGLAPSVMSTLSEVPLRIWILIELANDPLFASLAPMSEQQRNLRERRSG